MAEQEAAGGQTIGRPSSGRRRTFAVAAALLVAAGILAAILLPGSGQRGGSPAAQVIALARGPGAAGHGAAGRAVARGQIAIAAEYLGTSRAKLWAEMRSGHTLANVADHTPGKSVAGLIDVLVRERTAALERRGLSADRLRTRLSKVRRAMTRSVNRLPGSGGPSARVVSLAAAYLGVPAERLRAGLGRGRTLAEVARTTPGRSEAGLVAALLAGERSRLQRAVQAGRLDPARESRALSAAQRRLSAVVRR